MGDPQNYDYDVALSFAGEDRKYAKELAECLTSNKVRIFYDEYEKAELWGKDLYERLARIYKDEAFYCVIFISEHYAAKLWTKHELRNAQARAFKENREYILPLRLDDTELPGIPSTIGYLDIRMTPVREVCKVILQKLAKSGSTQSDVLSVTGSISTAIPPSGATTLVGLMDDLIVSVDASGAGTWDTMAIYIPPGFSVPGVKSQMSNEVPHIEVLSASQFDRYGPQWSVVYVPADVTTYGNVAVSPDSEKPVVTVISENGRYKVRISGVRAPSTAGKYFFKVAIFSSEGATSSDIYRPLASRFIPAENWPALLVMGEFDSANIAGTILRADRDPAEPVTEAGKVEAVMLARIDPQTGQVRGGHHFVNAVGYFNATAKGHYEMEGLAPGVYDLYASAAGYPKALIRSRFTVLKGQSLHFDGYLKPGPVIRGRVLGNEPWPDNSYVKVELYDAPTLDRVPDPSARLISWSPSRSDARVKTFGKPRGPQEVGPPQRWVVKGGTSNPFDFKFGDKEDYGAPRDLDGMVPQVYATWVNGLTPGRYYARAWVSGYSQSTEDRTIFQEYYFDIAPNKTDEVNLVIELRGK